MTKTTQHTGPESIDRRITALESFKDWSNYLLVTTVAALGWVAEQNTSSSWAMSIAVWCLGISTVAGIFSLALVPLIAEQMNDEESIYLVPARFFLVGNSLRTMYLSQACRPQHVSFIVGVIFYCLAKAEGAAKVTTTATTEATLTMRASLILPVTLIVVFVLIGRASHRREPKKNDPRA